MTDEPLHTDDYFLWDDHTEDRAVLDGKFSAKNLREIADYMEKHYRPWTIADWMASGFYTLEEAEWLASDDDRPMPASLGPPPPR